MMDARLSQDAPDLAYEIVAFLSGAPVGVSTYRFYSDEQATGALMMLSYERLERMADQLEGSSLAMRRAGQREFLDAAIFHKRGEDMVFTLVPGSEDFR